MTAQRTKAAEETPWYYIADLWYTGSEPWFYDATKLPGTKVLEENHAAIREEIESVLRRHGDEFRPNFTPYAWTEPGWKTVNLYSYFLKYPKNCERFPRIAEIVERIPGMCLAQIAVLEPHVRLKAHRGDTNALIRSHLGIVVPEGDLGIKVGRETRRWEEGRVLAIQIAHRHYAWNRTDAHRVVLVVDVMRPPFLDRRYEVASRALAAIAMKLVATRFPALKRIPHWLTRAIHAGLAPLFRLRLWLQRRTGL